MNIYANKIVTQSNKVFILCTFTLTLRVQAMQL